MKIIVFGFGSTGSVLVKTLDLLSKKYLGYYPEYLIFIRNYDKALSYIHKYKDLMYRCSFVTINNFDDVKNFVEENISDLKDNVDLFINASLPEYNKLIQELSLKINANYVDFASNLYNEETLLKGRLLEFDFEHYFIEKSRFGLVSLGVSPGLTNFLISQKINELLNVHESTKVDEINIFLFEDIRTSKFVFSWSPKILIEEIINYPVFIENGQPKKVEPFSNYIEYVFEGELHNSYPIFQEELFLLSKYSQNLKMYLAGSEIEFIKYIYDLNLLDVFYENSKSRFFVNNPDEIENLILSNVIKKAKFIASANIYFSLLNENKKGCLVVNLNYSNYLDTVNSIHYSGSTYIGYLSGVSGGIILFFSYMDFMNGNNKIKGIMGADSLPLILNKKMLSDIQKEILFHGIEISESLHLYK